MSTAEERLQILKMIEEGKISPQEGAELLSAMNKPSPPSMPSGPQARWLRVRVTDLNTGRRKVNVNIPLGLVDVSLRMGARFVPESANVDLNEIAQRIRSGAHGKVFEATNEDANEQIEIFLE